MVSDLWNVFYKNTHGQLERSFIASLEECFFFLNLGAAKPNTEFNKLNNLTSSYYCEGKRYETEV